MNVWKHKESGEIRLTASEGYDEVPLDKLEQDEQMFVRFKMSEADLKAADADTQEKLGNLSRQVDETLARLSTLARPKAEDKPQAISFAKLARAMKTGSWEGAEYEESVVKGESARALAANSDTSGGYIVPAEYMANEFIDLIYNKTAVMAAGARRLSGLKGSPVQLPKMTGGATTYWVGENSTINASDQSFGMLTLQPKKLAALTPMSNELIYQSTPAVESIVREDLARAIGVELDRAALLGDGADGEPVGLLNTSGIGDIAASAAITPDYMWDLVYKVEEAELNPTGGAFMLSHKQWNELRQAGDSSSYPKFYEGAGYTVTKACNGYPVFTNGNLGDAYGIFGLWRELLIGEWGGMNFALSNSATDGTNHAFVLDQTWIRATMLVDVAVRRPEAFAFNDNFT